MSGRGRHLAAVVVCVLVASACTSAADAPPGQAGAAQPDEPTASTTSTAEPAREGEVTLAFAGDVHFEGGVAGCSSARAPAWARSAGRCVPPTSRWSTSRPP